MGMKSGRATRVTRPSGLTSDMLKYAGCKGFAELLGFFRKLSEVGQC